MRVLIVEKEQSCGHELASRLSCQGMVADIAFEGNDVVRLIKKEPA